MPRVGGVAEAIGADVRSRGCRCAGGHLVAERRLVAATLAQAKIGASRYAVPPRSTRKSPLVVGSANCHLDADDLASIVGLKSWPSNSTDRARR